MLKTLAQDLRNLKFEERNLLDLTKYNILVASYNDYVNQVASEMQPIVDSFNHTLAFVGALASSTSLLALAYICIKRLYMWR